MAQSPEMLSLLDQARRTRALHLTDMCLTAVPPVVWTLTDLVRLDLGNNSLTELPDDVAKMTRLEELWLNGNPLRSVTPQLEQCRALKVLDLRDTAVRTLPRELSRLKCIIDIDLRGAPLDARTRQAYTRDCDTDGLMEMLRLVDRRTEVKLKLKRRLKETVYREVADSKEGEEGIQRLVENVLIEFTDFDELKSVLRNAERLFPEDLDMADARVIKRTYVVLKRENQMKKLAAEVELKLRAIYFNVIRPERVEGIVKGIYGEITTLNDMKFLLFYATQLFPPTPDEIDPKELKKALLGLRRKFAEEREAAIKGIETSLKAIYTDQEPEKIRRLANDVAALFKRVADLKQIGADAAVYFPAEYSSAKPHRIQRKYLQVQQEKAAEEL